MPNCDMCGSERILLSALIEGTTLQVCSSCAKHGKIAPLQPQQNRDLQLQKAKQKTDAEMDYLLVDNFASVIKLAREQKGIQQKELAQLLKEKESLLQKIESGHLQPSLSLAKKLERVLRISLLRLYTPPEKIHSSSGDVFTIGDLITYRKQ